MAASFRMLASSPDVAAILAYLKDHPEEGRTSAEIASATGLNPHSVAGRLPNMREAGLVSRRRVKSPTKSRTIGLWTAKTVGDDGE